MLLPNFQDVPKKKLRLESKASLGLSSDLQPISGFQLLKMRLGMGTRLQSIGSLFVLGSPLSFSSPINEGSQSSLSQSALEAKRESIGGESNLMWT